MPPAPLALVPVRAAPSAKARLAHVLGPDERTRLVQELSEGVIGVLRGRGLRTVVVAAGEAPLPAADEVWWDDGVGLNLALRRAYGRASLPLLVVQGDLPWLRAEDVDTLIAEEGDVVIARARDGGTGAMLLRQALEPAFGPGSAIAHASAARRRGLHARVVDIEGFARDLDDERSLSVARPSRSRRTRGTTEAPG